MEKKKVEEKTTAVKYKPFGIMMPGELNSTVKFFVSFFLRKTLLILSGNNVWLLGLSLEADLSWNWSRV